MSWVVAIDESGGLGKDTRFFSMAALIVRRPRYLKKAYDCIPKKNFESKFYNSTNEEICTILGAIAESNIMIICSTVDKYNHEGRLYGMFGNNLYRAVLSELLDLIGETVPNSDVQLMLDRCRFISIDELRDIATSKMLAHGCQLKRCEKRNSDETPCIQVIDYIVGAINHDMNNNERTLTDIIREKVVVARTD